MRHVRILGLCLLAVFALGAIVAGPALAKKPAKEHVPGTLEGEWKPYNHCPLDNAEFINPPEEWEGFKYVPRQNYCVFGATLGGKNGGSFTVGGITVPLNKSIKIQGGLVGYEGPNEEIDGRFIGPEGSGLLEAPLLKVPKGIGLITPTVMKEANWPRTLEESYDYAKVHKETGLTAHIIVAGGNEIFEEQNAVNPTALLEQQGPAFTLPLRVVLNGPWLESLNSGECTIGTEEHPIVQHLTSGTSEAPAPFEFNTQSGSAGFLTFNPEFTNLILHETKLVDSTWPVEVPAEGCGGAYESYVDDAISDVLHLPAPAGSSFTVLTGTLSLGEGEVVFNERETGTFRG